MRLNEICEPLFTYICRLNRSVRLGGPAYDASHVRSDIDAILKRMEQSSEIQGQADQVRRMRLPLLFFVDYVIASSNLPWASEWPRLAHEVSEFAGDEKFFHPLLDDTLADPSPEAAARAEVFYSCMGLGMTGVYADRPEEFQNILAKVASRIRDRMEGDELARICDEAYKHTDTRILFQPATDKMGTIAVSTLGLLAVVFIVTGVIYKAQVGGVSRQINNFLTTPDTQSAVASSPNASLSSNSASSEQARADK